MGPRCTWLFLVHLIRVIVLKGFSRCRGYWSILLSICRVYIQSIYICSAGSVELPVVVLLYLLQCLVYHMMSKTRRNSRSLHRVIGYNYICYIYLVYKFGQLCRAAYCSVVSTSMLGVSHAVQNEKKLQKFTPSDGVYICSAGYAELPIVLLYLLRCLVYHMLSKTRRNSRSLHRVIAYICYIYFDAWCITCC